MHAYYIKWGRCGEQQEAAWNPPESHCIIFF